MSVEARLRNFLANLREYDLNQVKDLNCVRKVKFPVSYSVHSVDLIPTNGDTGLVSLTLRIDGEIRVVHGTLEIQEIVCKVLKSEDSSSEGELLKRQDAFLKRSNLDIDDKGGLQKLCTILERLTRAGWEVLTSGKFTSTPGYELVTFVLKRNATPLNNADVAAVVLDDDEDATVVSENHFNEVEDILNSAKTKSEESSSAEKSKTFASSFILELSQLLFCRQWKLISSCNTPKGTKLFFCRDGRILPALGQEKFSLIELQKPNTLLLFHVQEEVGQNIENIVKEVWTDGIESSKFDEEPKMFILKEDPWNKTCHGDDQTYILRSQLLLTKLLLGLNKAELNVFASLSIKGAVGDRALIILRQSNISYSNALVLQPKGLNKLAVHGASEEDLQKLRECITSRWPYPLTGDAEISDGWHLFKVKRYPWAVSYGNKHVDRAVEVAKVVLAQRDISLPNPTNMDSESAKSLLCFVIKEMSSTGWRLQMTAEVCSEQKKLFNSELATERINDVNALFFLR